MPESRGSLNGKRGLSTFTLRFTESEKARRPYEGITDDMAPDSYLISNNKITFRFEVNYDSC